MRLKMLIWLLLWHLLVQEHRYWTSPIVWWFYWGISLKSLLSSLLQQTWSARSLDFVHLTWWTLGRGWKVEVPFALLDDSTDLCWPQGHAWFYFFLFYWLRQKYLFASQKECSTCHPIREKMFKQEYRGNKNMCHAKKRRASHREKDVAMNVFLSHVWAFLNGIQSRTIPFGSYSSLSMVSCAWENRWKWGAYRKTYTSTRTSLNLLKFH